MTIESEVQLKAAVAKVDILLQEIQDYCHSKDATAIEYTEAKVRFPRGFIRPAAAQRARLPFVKDATLVKNLSYTLILSDTLLWLVIRTDLWGIPKEMLIKLNVFLLGSMCESITKDYLKGICGKNFEGRTKHLADTKIITSKLKDEIDWVWEVRNKMHLFQLEDTEYYNDYSMETNRRAVTAFRGLLNALALNENTLQ